MERLTARSTKNGMAYLIGVKQDEQIVESKFHNTLRCIQQAMERLAEYEDEGVDPQGFALYEDQTGEEE